MNNPSCVISGSDTVRDLHDTVIIKYIAKDLAHTMVTLQFQSAGSPIIKAKLTLTNHAIPKQTLYYCRLQRLRAPSQVSTYSGKKSLKRMLHVASNQKGTLTVTVHNYTWQSSIGTPKGNVFLHRQSLGMYRSV